MNGTEVEGSAHGLFPRVSRSEFDPALVLPDGASTLSAPDRAIWRRDMRRPAPDGAYRRAGKRALDVSLVLFTLPFSLPIIGFCALALWIEGGQPFYVQPRIGRAGRIFQILKLRTMTRDADAALVRLLRDDPALRREWDAMQKLRHDPRITRVGRFLRATSLDELPQLYNVLTGEMSLVGPRPMMPDQLALYGEAGDYMDLRPGITGPWQVSTRNANTFSARQEIDRDYNRGLRFGTDLSLLVRTVRVVLNRTGC